jgi:hypothetical protein
MHDQPTPEPMRSVHNVSSGQPNAGVARFCRRIAPPSGLPAKLCHERARMRASGCAPHTDDVSGHSSPDRPLRVEERPNRIIVLSLSSDLTQAYAI